MRLRSTAFSDGGPIPRRYSCDGDDLSPPLQWSDAPAETRSFVVLCDDPDAPAGTWHHWAAYDIPANHTMLPEGAARSAGRRDLNRPPMILAGRAMAVHARHAATERITIISGC
jgi:Raf kinase inhibitor-like YbhB/YbcL family protein